MSKSIGILLGSDGDLMIKPIRVNGLIVSGLTIGNSLAQNQYCILMAQKAELKGNPTLGVGIEDMDGDENPDEWTRTIRKEYSKDGLIISQIGLVGGEMNIIADYK